MESPRELREKYHGHKRKRGYQYWGHRFFIHILPSYLAWVLIQTKITANQITVLMVLSGALGGGLMFMQGFLPKMIGFALLYLGIALDGVDGDIARYRGVFSLRGVYLDDVQHLIVPPLMLFGLAYSVSKVTLLNPDWLIVSAAVGGIGWMIIKVNGKEPFHIMGKHFLRDPKKYNLIEGKNIDKPELAATEAPVIGKGSILRRLLAIRFQLRQFLLAVLIFFSVMVIERLFVADYASFPVTSWLIVGYGVFLTLHVIEEIVKSYFYIDGWVTNTYKGMILENETLKQFEEDLK